MGIDIPQIILSKFGRKTCLIAWKITFLIKIN